jgi:hypothetical protein
MAFFTYIILTIQWFIIGAIINPVAYLPFASAAFTFVVVISGIIRS